MTVKRGGMWMCVFRVLVHVKIRMVVALLARFCQQHPPSCSVPPSSVPAWWVCFSWDQGDFCCVWNLWDCCGSAFLAPVHVYILHHTCMLLHVYVKPAPSHRRRADLCSLGWFFCCTQGRRHVRKKLSSSLHVYEPLIHGGVGGQHRNRALFWD